MRNKIFIIFFVSLLFFGGWAKPVFAKVYVQKDGLFSINVPEGWHWFEYPQEIVLTYPDGKTMGIDIQFNPSSVLGLNEIKKNLKENDEKMIKQGIEAHGGALIRNIETSLDGVYARQLDFNPTPKNPLHVTYIALFNKGYAFTITYGSGKQEDSLMMQKAVETFKFNKR